MKGAQVLFFDRMSRPSETQTESALRSNDLTLLLMEFLKKKKKFNDLFCATSPLEQRPGNEGPRLQAAQTRVSLR